MPTGAMLYGLDSVGKLALSLTLCAIGIVSFGIPFAKWRGLGGIAFAMAANKLVTFWPIQVYEARRPLRASEPAPLANAGQPRVIFPLGSNRNVN